jgi:hypothetical protein
MAVNLPHDKARKKAIRELQERLAEDAGGKLPTAKLVVKGQVKQEPIYRFPTGELRLNKSNGRIKSEVLATEAHLGRSLDPDVEEDQAILKRLLLSIRPDENKKIKEDLRKTGQIQPGIVTCDGIVVNGNRRKSLLEELFDDTGDEAFKYLEVHVLPATITRAEIWLIEAGIQLSAPQQLDYSPINNLLKLREGIDSGITVPQMAARIYGMDEDRLQEDLDRLTLMDEYLGSYLDKRRAYHLLKDKAEHFINLQNTLSWLEHPVGNVPKDWDFDAHDINELKLVAFHYIRARFAHMRIRELRYLFCLKDSWKELKKAVPIPVTAPDSQKPRTGGSADDSLDDGDLEPGDGTSEERDALDEKAWRDDNISTLKEYFEGAKEQQQIHKDARAPLALARRALRSLDGVRSDSDGFDDPELDVVLGKIIRRVNELRSYHMKRRPTRKKAEKKTKRPAKTSRTTTQKKKSRGKPRRPRKRG